MASHLKSFDFDDSFTSRKVNSSSVRITKVVSSDDENNFGDDGFDFDNTELETPKSLRQSGDTRTLTGFKNAASSASNQASSHISLVTVQAEVSGVVQKSIRSTTVEVPLKDGDELKRSSNGPNGSNGSPFKYRSRNGTPLRKPPITRDSSQADGKADEESYIIRSRKLITDDNKFSPKLSPRKTPIRLNGKIGFDEASVVVSPPPTFKLTQPLDFRQGANGNKKRKVQRDDSSHNIEFDPSDVEDSRGEKEHAFKSPSKYTTSVLEVVQEEDKQTDDRVGEVKQTSEDEKDKDEDEKDEEKEDEELEAAAEEEEEEGEDVANDGTVQKEFDSEISKAGIFRRIDAAIKSAKLKQNSEAGVPVSPRLSIHREIFERINSPEQSPVRNSSSLEKSPVRRNVPISRGLGISNFANDEIEEEEDDEDDGDEVVDDAILDELDSYLIPQDTRGTESADGPAQSAVSTSSLNWPASKWSKLKKIIALDKLTTFEIINNSLVQQSLGVSKKDLAKRVNFLIELKKQQRLGFIRSSKQNGNGFFSKYEKGNGQRGRKGNKQNIQPKSSVNRKKLL